MPTPIALEAELRRNVIDRLINASLNHVSPAREENLQRWRLLKTARGELAAKSDINPV
jgi:hypothetical protein